MKYAVYAKAADTVSIGYLSRDEIIEHGKQGKISPDALLVHVGFFSKEEIMAQNLPGFLAAWATRPSVSPQPTEVAVPQLSTTTPRVDSSEILTELRAIRGECEKTTRAVRGLLILLLTIAIFGVGGTIVFK